MVLVLHGILVMDQKIGSEKPIDEKPGFLAFDIEIAPWVYWQTGFEI